MFGSCLGYLLKKECMTNVWLLLRVYTFGHEGDKKVQIVWYSVKNM